MPFPPINTAALHQPNGEKLGPTLDPRNQQIDLLLGIQSNHHQMRKLKKHIKRKIQKFREEYRVMAALDEDHHVMVNLDEIVQLENTLKFLCEHIKVTRQRKPDRNVNVKVRGEAPVPRLLPYSEPTQDVPKLELHEPKNGSSQFLQSDQSGQAEMAAVLSDCMVFQSMTATAIPFTTVGELNEPLLPLVREQYIFDQEAARQSGETPVKVEPTEIKHSLEDTLINFVRESRKSLGICLSESNSRGPVNGIKKMTARRTRAKKATAKKTPVKKSTVQQPMTMTLRPRRR